MENNINTYCTICGRGYHVCKSCSKQKSFQPWRSVTDTIEHYKIYLAIHGYTLSSDRQRARRELETCDLSEIQTFNENIQKTISEIMTADTPQPETGTGK